MSEDWLTKRVCELGENWCIPRVGMTLYDVPSPTKGTPRIVKLPFTSVYVIRLNCSSRGMMSVE